MKYIIALDAGTTSVRAMLYDLKQRKFVHCAQQEVGQNFPHPGWVEQDADEIYYKSVYVLNSCITLAGAENVAGIGIANQRETVVFWDRRTGDPVCPAIVWQCRRTSEFCSRIPEEIRRLIRERTGFRRMPIFLPARSAGGSITSLRRRACAERATCASARWTVFSSGSSPRSMPL